MVWSKIRKATEEDKEPETLAETIQTGKWNAAKQIIESIRQRIIHSAHKQGHLGVNKTKEMIRRKYWFPGMNIRIEDAVQSCFDCQIATDNYHTEPAKMTPLPDRPCDVIEADFCGPSTSISPVKKKLKKIFYTHGVPRTLQTDNGPPFNGEQFQAFLTQARNTKTPKGAETS